MSKGCACQFFLRAADDAMQAMSKGVGGACECPRGWVVLVNVQGGGGVLVNAPPFRTSCIRACSGLEQNLDTKHLSNSGLAIASATVYSEQNVDTI